MKRLFVCCFCIACIIGICGYAVADEEKTDFLFTDGFSWSTPLEEYYSHFGMSSSVDRDDSNGVAAMVFDGLEVPGIEGTSSMEFYFLEGQPFLAMCMIDVDRGFVPLALSTKMQDAYETLINEGNRIYANRSEVLFSSVEELTAIWEDRFDYSPYVSGFLNSLTTAIGAFQDMYATNGFDCLTDAKAWMVDDQFGVAVMYSGQRIGDDTIVVVYLNVPNMLNAMGAFTSSDEEAEDDSHVSRFGLPEGINWKDENEKVKEQLGSSYLGEEDALIYADFAGDELVCGYNGWGMFAFSDDELLGIYYVVEDADLLIYQDIIAVLGDDYGSPVNDETTMQSAKQLSETIEKAEIWITDDVEILCAYDPADSIVYVVNFCWAAFYQ